MPAYDQSFFDSHHAGSLSSARVIVPMLMELVAPASIVDVGCGDGAWLSVFAERGVSDHHGIDGPWVNPDRLAIARDRFTRADLASPPALGRRFDLALSLEVAEHLPASAADGFIASLVRLAPVVVFSAAIPGQGGTGHVNEQWPDHWADRFSAHGYTCIDTLRMRVWDDPAVAWWYAQNILIFAAADSVAALPALHAAANAPGAGSRPRRLVHPGCLDASHRQLLELSRILHEGPGAVRRAFARLFKGTN